MVLDILPLGFIEDPEFEADDILGTIVDRAKDFMTYVVSGDKDTFQLISYRTNVLYYRTKEKAYTNLTPDLLIELFGYAPHHVVHLKSLAGDQADNIPGCPGIGQKTALRLLAQYGSIGEVIANSTNIPGKLGERIRDNIENIRLSYALATIRSDCPISSEPSSYLLNINMEKGSNILQGLSIKKVELGKFIHEPIF